MFVVLSHVNLWEGYQIAKTMIWTERNANIISVTMVDLFHRCYSAQLLVCHFLKRYLFFGTMSIFFFFLSNFTVENSEIFHFLISLGKVISWVVSTQYDLKYYAKGWYTYGFLRNCWKLCPFSFVFLMNVDCFSWILQDLEKSKPVILTGDLNCAHQEIDIFNPAVSYITQYVFSLSSGINFSWLWKIHWNWQVLFLPRRPSLAVMSR